MGTLAIVALVIQAILESPAIAGIQGFQAIAAKVVTQDIVVDLDILV